MSIARKWERGESLKPTPCRMASFLSSQNGFSGANNIRYINPELDSLIERYFATIAPIDRVPVMEQIVRHVGENLNVMGLFYDMEFTLVGNRLQSITAREVTLWDVNQWDTKS